MINAQELAEYLAENDQFVTYDGANDIYGGFDIGMLAERIQIFLLLKDKGALLVSQGRADLC